MLGDIGHGFSESSALQKHRREHGTDCWQLIVVEGAPGFLQWDSVICSCPGEPPTHAWVRSYSLTQGVAHTSRRAMERGGGLVKKKGSQGREKEIREENGLPVNMT